MKDNHSSFNEYSKYYDLIYQDKNYALETQYIHSLIKLHRPGSKSILELGSGTGKHAFLLANLGYSMLGIEPSREMIKIATTNCSRDIEFQEGSIQSFVTEKKFDVAIALFHVISYVNENNELIRSFKKVHDHLEAGGIFIFDVWHSAAVLTQLPENRTKIVENKQLRVTRKAHPEIDWVRNIVNVHYDIHVEDKSLKKTYDFKELHPMRYFSIPEIEFIAKLSGFTMVTVASFYNTQEVGPDTWGVGFVLKKL